MSTRALPDWLRLWFQRALLGEIYPAIRAIAVSFSESRALVVRIYLDREPTQEDRESAACVMTEILANTSSNDEIRSAEEECLLSGTRLCELDPLDGFVYARREYDSAGAEQIATHEPPLPASSSNSPVHRSLDSLPAPVPGGSR